MARHKGLVSKIAKFVADPSAAMRPRSLNSQARSFAKSMKKVNKARNELFDAQDRETAIRARIEGRSPANTAAYEAKVRQKLDGTVARIFYKKLVGVSFLNADGTNRKNAIRSLRQHEELTLVRDLSNPVDPNAILVTSPKGRGLGYLDARLAGEVSRSLDKGIRWHCYVRRVLSTEGTDHCGVTVCLVKHRKVATPSTTKRRERASTPAAVVTPVHVIVLTSPEVPAPKATKSTFRVFLSMLQEMFK